MVRQTRHDRQNGTAGPLTRAFRGTRLDMLEKMFVATPAGQDRAAAEAVLQQFHGATRRLRLSENAFNNRARARQGAKPSLLKHLRDPEQFAAIRAFGAAKQALLSVNPDIGRKIARLAIAEDIALRGSAAPAAAPQPAAFRR